jgi:hypothetical protein
VHLSFRWLNRVEGPYERYTDTSIIEAFGVSTHFRKSSSFVGIAIATRQEIVPYVTPASAFHVKRLNFFGRKGTLSLKGIRENLKLDIQNVRSNVLDKKL